MGDTLLSLGPIVTDMMIAVANGLAREICAFGPRGEAKTIGALGAMIYHSNEHERRQFVFNDAGEKVLLKLPVTWMGITDFHRSHTDKTKPSLLKDFWQGAWTLHDDAHIAVFKTNVDRVVLNLFGIEDEGAADKARRETHCVWVEEPAPATTGHGVDPTSYSTAITSQRLATHAKVALLTTNYPERKHWTWTRFMPSDSGAYGRHPEDPTRMWFRVPKGDNPYTSDKDRAEWAHALRDRPDLAARLLEGKPGSVQIGRAVATQFLNGAPIGFNEARHVSDVRLRPIKGVPFQIGQDGGLSPVTTIAQSYGGHIYVYASLVMDGGMRQQYEHQVIPWFREHAPWAIKRDDMIFGCYDGSMPDDESDSDRNPMDVIGNMLGGYWEPGPISWEGRKGPMLASFNRVAAGSSFEPAVKIDPVDCEILIDALRGAWYYKEDRFGNVSGDKPHKPNHPYEDCGDSYCYMTCAALPELTRIKSPDQGRQLSKFDARFYDDLISGGDEQFDKFDGRVS